MIKELKFTDENLLKHIDSKMYKNYKTIVTTRDEIKGECGDLFHIRGVGFAVLYSIDEYYPSEREYVYGDNSPLYELEGFKTMEKFNAELERIYGDKIYNGLRVHFLQVIRANQYFDMVEDALGILRQYSAGIEQ